MDCQIVISKVAGATAPFACESGEKLAITETTLTGITPDYAASQVVWSGIRASTNQSENQYPAVSALWRETPAPPFSQQLHQTRPRIALLPALPTRPHVIVGALDKFDPLVCCPRPFLLGPNIRDKNVLVGHRTNY